jgi:hypothetical protein
MHPHNQKAMNKEMYTKLKESKERLRQRIKDNLPPEDVRKYIEEKTQATFKLNEGNLDKESFRLGMYAMWSYMKKQTP